MASRSFTPPSTDLDLLVAEVAAAGGAPAGELVRTAWQRLRERPPVAWPVGGGECGALIRDRDWSQTPLGDAADWPVELRTTVNNVVNSPIAKAFMWGPAHTMFYNDAYRAIAGDRHPRALGMPLADAFPEVWNWNAPIMAAGMAGESAFHHDQPILFNRPDGGELLILDLFYTPVYAGDGQPGGVLCTMVDNSARVAAEQRLADREAELRRITDAMPQLVAYIDRDHRYRFANAAYQAWFGVAPERVIGHHVREILGEAAYAERVGDLRRALAGEVVVADTVLPIQGGQLRRCELRYLPDRAADGSVPGVHVLGLDVEERALREAAVAASNLRFRTAMDAVHGVLWTNSADGRMEGEQPGWAALTGQTPAEYQGYGWAEAVHPDDAAATVAAWHAAVAAKAPFIHEHRVRRQDGQWRSFAIRALPVLDAAGEIGEWVGVHTDISHQRAAEAALRQHADDLARQVRHRQRAEDQLRQLNETLESRVLNEIGERREAEARLAQAQKLETVGKLTGGVAHDFNNLLQVVGGNLQLLAGDVAGSDRAERRVANAMAGVARGAKLAAQLLAFGRRQALEPRVVNLARLLAGMDDMLRRAIGEAVEVEVVAAPGLWNSLVDPAQVENAILNLAINARDAMDGRGRLVLQLANLSLDAADTHAADEVVPGDYVVLAVTDTGSGMAPEILEKVFEPFFSTKAEGKGTGLGLSMVYGFVKQSGGHVKIESVVDRGTTIRLLLPRAAAAEEQASLPETGPVVGGSETVLVVEDNDAVRATVVEMLVELGYRVLKAVDAASALAVVESGVPIDLLFTDVVMPGRLKSPELAKRARERLPDIAVLFTSGYTQNSIVHGGRLDPGVDLLSKPYTREALARKFRHVLGNQRQRLAAAAAATRPLPAATTAAPPALQRSVLLVEDDALIRAGLAEFLVTTGFRVATAANAEEAATALRAAAVDVLVTDVNLPGASGPALAATARALRPGVAIVYATGDPGAVRGEADAQLLVKPFDRAALVAAVDAAILLARRARVAAD